MQTFRVLFFTGLSALIMTSCISYPVPRYAVSVENIQEAKRIYAPNGLKLISSANSSAQISELSCRAAGPIAITDGSTYADYISNGLRDELSMAELLKSSSNEVLKLQISKIEVSTMPARWTITGSTEWRGQTKPISYSKDFNSSFFGQNACTEIANNFSTAVKGFNHRVIEGLSTSVSPRKP